MLGFLPHWREAEVVVEFTTSMVGISLNTLTEEGVGTLRDVLMGEL